MRSSPMQVEHEVVMQVPTAQAVCRKSDGAEVGPRLTPAPWEDGDVNRAEGQKPLPLAVSDFPDPLNFDLTGSGARAGQAVCHAVRSTRPLRSFTLAQICAAQELRA